MTFKSVSIISYHNLKKTKVMVSGSKGEILQSEVNPSVAREQWKIQ